MTLSVTVLSYNYGHYLEGCLQGILAQSYKDFEVIVIDDASSDDTSSVVKPFLSDPRVQYIRHEKNAGFVKSLIEGVEHSSGEYITVISADDLVVNPNAFAMQIQLLDREPEAGFCATGYRRFRTDFDALIENKDFLPADVVLDRRRTAQVVLGDPFLLHSGCIIRRSAYDAVGGYDPNLTYCVDVDLWVKLASSSRLAYCAGPLYGYRVHNTNMSRSMTSVRRTTREIMSVVKPWLKCAERTGLVTPAFRHDTERRLVAVTALDDAFSGYRNRAARDLLAAVQVEPGISLTSRDWWVAAARTALGESGYRHLRKVLGPAGPAGQPSLHPE